MAYTVNGYYCKDKDTFCEYATPDHYCGLTACGKQKHYTVYSYGNSTWFVEEE